MKIKKSEAGSGSTKGSSISIIRAMAAPVNALPPDADLRRALQFSSADGRIWLAGQRMLLVHAAALGALRRELMGSIGREQTRRVLMRAGYASGERDAVKRDIRCGF